jgi:hypothetical protein
MAIGVVANLLPFSYWRGEHGSERPESNLDWGLHPGEGSCGQEAQDLRDLPETAARLYEVSTRCDNEPLTSSTSRAFRKPQRLTSPILSRTRCRKALRPSCSTTT